MSSKPSLSQRPAVTAFLLAVLIHAPALAQYLVVTSSPDPNRVEPGVTTLTVKATAPEFFAVGKYRLVVSFTTSPGDPTPWTGTYEHFYSPEKTLKTGATFSHDFPVPAATTPGDCHAMVSFEHYNDDYLSEPGWHFTDGVCRDVSLKKLHRETGPVTESNNRTIISPPPVQKPPKQEPRPYEPPGAGGTLSKPSSSQKPPAAQSARRGAIRPGERLTLHDGRILVMQGSTLVLFAPEGYVLRSYPPGTEAVVGAGGEVSVRTGATSERLGTIRK